MTEEIQDKLDLSIEEQDEENDFDFWFSQHKTIQVSEKGVETDN